ncbi:MAG: hypothetical protein ACJ8DI_16890 [Ktedonobacteraceae bacterium]
MTGQYLRKLWKSGLLIFILVGVFACYLLFKPGGFSTSAVTLVDNVSQVLLEGIGLVLALPLFLQGTGRRGVSFGMRGASARTSQRWAPVLLGLGILSYVIGQAIWTYNENIAHLPVLFPSWADAGFLGSFPLVLLALLLLPTQPLPASMRSRIVLNSLIIMVTMTTFSWYFILGPTILEGDYTLLGQLISAAYPLATLVLIFCLLLLVIRSHDPTIQPVALVLGLAFIIIVLTDSVYNVQQLHDAYYTGTLLDVGWPLGYMLVGLGARALRLVMATRPLPPDSAPNAPETSEEKPVQLISRSLFWQSLLPFLFLPAMMVLLDHIISTYKGTILEEGVILGTAVFVGLLILRQIFVIEVSIRENHKLWEMYERVTRAELRRERAERLKVERILALNEALVASQQERPHARIVAFGHYQIRDSSGIYFNVYHRDAGEHQTFECECPQYQQQGICPHSLTAAALHSVSDSPQQ